MSTNFNIPEASEYDEKRILIEALDREISGRLTDMGEISTLDPREVEVLDSIREQFKSQGVRFNEPGVSPVNFQIEIPEKLRKEYVRTMFEVEQDKLKQNLVQVGTSRGVETPFMRRLEQAKALEMEMDIEIDENIKYVLGL